MSLFCWRDQWRSCSNTRTGTLLNYFTQSIHHFHPVFVSTTQCNISNSFYTIIVLWSVQAVDRRSSVKHQQITVTYLQLINHLRFTVIYTATGVLSMYCRTSSGNVDSSFGTNQCLGWPLTTVKTEECKHTITLLFYRTSENNSKFLLSFLYDVIFSFPSWWHTSRHFLLNIYYIHKHKAKNIYITNNTYVRMNRT